MDGGTCDRMIGSTCGSTCDGVCVCGSIYYGICAYLCGKHCLRGNIAFVTAHVVTQAVGWKERILEVCLVAAGILYTGSQF